MFEGHREGESQRLSRRGILLAAVLGALAGPMARWLQKPAGPTGPTVSFQGFGPVRVGMTVAEASDALGARLVEDAASEPCHPALTRVLPSGIVFVVLEGRIARIDVTSDLYRTAVGAGVGSSEREVRRLHPQAVVEEHPHYRDGHQLVLTDPEGRYAMVFETTGQVVTSFRAGERGPVVDGCR